MKLKITSTLLAMILTSISNASYEVSIGLTEDKKGPLPTNGIIFSNSKISNGPECRYDKTTDHWIKAVGGNTTRVVWNSEIIGSSLGAINYYDYNGYRYTPATQQTFAGPPFFEICRIKL